MSMGFSTSVCEVELEKAGDDSDVCCVVDEDAGSGEDTMRHLDDEKLRLTLEGTKQVGRFSECKDDGTFERYLKIATEEATNAMVSEG